MTSKEALQRFDRDCQLRGLKPKTIVNYMASVQRFLVTRCIVDIPEDLSVDDVEEYILFLHRQDLSKATVATYLRPVRIFLRFLESKKILDADLGIGASVKLPRSPVRKVDILTTTQLQQLFADVDPSDVLSVRNALILALMLDSGLRRNEVITLQLKHLNLGAKTIKVLGKGDKERIVPIGNFTLQLLKLYLRMTDQSHLRKTHDEKKYLLLGRRGNPITENAIKLMINKKSSQLGIKFSAHKLRHNFATNYCLDEYQRNGNMDIYKLQAIMGHEDLITTMRYMHLAQEIYAASSSISHLDYIKIEL